MVCLLAGLLSSLRLMLTLSRPPKLPSSLSSPSFPCSTAFSSSASSPKLSVSFVLHPLVYIYSHWRVSIQKTATGIFLPSSSTSSPLPEATVISVGPGARDKNGDIIPTNVKAGDRVLLPGWGGNPIKVGEEVSLLSFFR